ncbi:hypothetical protein NM208_g6840 [Fusarium decemcellulare]|uniref:Uncharacterized protein n=1 Tax=Fusarium decemcellulare TaxID=57161 RepID=A0ACC1SBH3_9HYPO|nr:hypothetical protein NM208_g6840 [Fusarium decemcellulare]
MEPPDDHDPSSPSPEPMRVLGRRQAPRAMPFYLYCLLFFSILILPIFVTILIFIWALTVCRRRNAIREAPAVKNPESRLHESLASLPFLDAGQTHVYAPELEAYHKAEERRLSRRLDLLELLDNNEGGKLEPLIKQRNEAKDKMVNHQKALRLQEMLLEDSVRLPLMRAELKQSTREFVDVDAKIKHVVHELYRVKRERVAVCGQREDVLLASDRELLATIMYPDVQ